MTSRLTGSRMAYNSHTSTSWRVCDAFASSKDGAPQREIASFDELRVDLLKGESFSSCVQMSYVRHQRIGLPKVF
jgi:hypothetical protein